MLRISLFGSVRIVRAGRVCEVGVTRAVQGLLAYLLLQRNRSHPREVLAGLFWGESTEDHARSSLNTTLWRLRRVLEPTGTPRGTYLVTTQLGEVAFNRKSPSWLDVSMFEETTTDVLERPLRACRAGDARALEAAVELYVGDLLEGFYDDWTLRERERLRCLHLNALTYLMRYHALHCEYEGALIWAQRILDLDPLREEIHREMMRLFLESGQRARAVQQYERCRAILHTELGIAPMEETQALYAQVVPHGQPPRSAGTARQPGTLREAMQQLRTAMRGFDEARERLQDAIRIVDDHADFASATDKSRNAATPAPRSAARDGAEGLLRTAGTLPVR